MEVKELRINNYLRNADGIIKATAIEQDRVWHGKDFDFIWNLEPTPPHA